MTTQEKRRFSVDDLWAMKRVGSPCPSPDGRRFIVPVTITDIEKNKGKTRLWIFEADGSNGHPITSDELSSEQPAFSPDGKRLLFVRRKEGEKAQLHLMPLDGGEAERLTDFPLGVFDPKWLPDGRHVAFAAMVVMGSGPAEPAPPGGAASGPATASGGPVPSPRKPAVPPEPESVARTRRILEAREAEPVRARVTEDRVFRFWDRWLTTGEVPHLFVLDLETRGAVDVTPDSTGWFDFMDPAGQYDLAPDGKEIAFSANASAPPHQLLKWDIFTVPLEIASDGRVSAGAVRSITPENTADSVRPRYSPDGKFLYFGFQKDPFFYADKVRLARRERATQKTTVLTEAWDRSPSCWEVVPDGAAVFVLAEHQARVALFQLAPAGAPDVKLLIPGGTLANLRVAGDGRLWFNWQDLSHPPEVATCRPDGSDFRIVTHFNDATLDELAMATVEEMTFPGADGKPIQMFVLFPPGFDPKKKWPLVHVIHGGPHGISGDQFHWRWNAQLFAAPGYVTAMINFHGSTSFGQDFAASILGAHGDKPFTDIMAGTDFLLRKGYIDETRMAAAGGSYGGYLVTWIVGHTDRFACVVNHAGVYDLLSQYASDVSQGRHVAYGGEPWSGIENVDRWSPNRFAAGFKSPMLVIHGDNDYRVPYTQGLEVYGVYKARGLPARLVSYPDENHWILSARNSRHWYGEVLGWLDRYLGRSE